MEVQSFKSQMNKNANNDKIISIFLLMGDLLYYIK